MPHFEAPEVDTPQSVRERYPAFEFLMRHIDDSPIGDSRHLQHVVVKAAETALGFALVGEVAAATKIVELLRAHSVDVLADHQPMSASSLNYPYLKPCMYFAWEATSSWPSWIPAEERTEAYLQGLEEAGRAPWLERFSEPWSVDADMAEKARVMAEKSVNKTFPDVSQDERIELAERWWREGQYPYTTNPNGSMSLRYRQMALWWRMGMTPYPFLQLHKSAGLMIALDVYLQIGNADESLGLFKEVCNRFTFTDQAEMMACSRGLWGQITQVSSPFAVLDALEIPKDRVKTGAEKALVMLETRLNQGPSRPFKHKNIRELVDIISTNTIQNYPYQLLVDEGFPRDKPRSKEALMRPPLSESSIAELDQRLMGIFPDDLIQVMGQTLPQDYKDFLAITDGMALFWAGGPTRQALARADDVQWCSFKEDFTKANILRADNPSLQGILDWPDFPGMAIDLTAEEAACRGLWLLDRSTTAKATKCVLQAHKDAVAAGQETHRREIERAVSETYSCGVDDLSALDFALVGWDTWSQGLVPYSGISGFLEVVAEGSRQPWRPWVTVFEPQFRRVVVGMDELSRVD